MEKLTRDIFLLGIISFFADASSEMIMPVLPFFVAAIGGGGIALGLIAGLGDGIASISKIFSGVISDRTGKRKVFIASGYGISAVSKFFFPLSSQWWHLTILRGIERVGKGIRGSPRDALIGDLYKERRGEAYGVHRALDTAGAILLGQDHFLKITDQGQLFAWLDLNSIRQSRTTAKKKTKQDNW